MITLRTIRRRNRQYFEAVSTEFIVKFLREFIEEQNNLPRAGLEIEACLEEIKRRVSKAEYNEIILKINENYWPAKRG